MSFYNAVTNFGRKAKALVGRGINHIKRGSQFARRKINEFSMFIDSVLDTAHNFPVLSELADEIERSDLYNGYRHRSGQINDFLDTVDSNVERVDGYIGGGGGGGVPYFWNEMVQLHPVGVEAAVM
jgi:hypothetical protein